MAKLGFRKRLQSILHGAFPIIPKPKPPRPPAPPVPTPRPPAPTGAGPRRRRVETDDFRQTYVEETLRRPGRDYRTMYGVVRDIPGFDQLDRDDQLFVWREFIKTTHKGQPTSLRNRNHPFWSRTNLSPRTFPWDEWRDMMRRLGSP